MNQILLFQAGLLCAARLAVAPGCDDGAPRESASDDGSTGGESIPLVVSSLLEHPPEPPSEPSPGDGPGAVFAIDAIHLGLPREDDAGSAPSWAEIGYDLDGTATASGRDASTRSCAPAAGASAKSGADGVGGIDNAFGRALVPVLAAANDDLEPSVNRAIADGEGGLLIALDGLGDAPTYTGLTATFYQPASLRRSWRRHTDGIRAFVVPLVAKPARTGHVEAPLAVLHDTYVADDGQLGTWVARGGDAIEIRIAALGLADPEGVVRLRLHDPVVSMTFGDDRGHATGVLAGKLRVDELKPELQRFLAHVAPFFCEGLALEALVAHVDRTADLRADGLVDPALPCDAISFGIAFEASRAQLGAAVPPPDPPSDPCAP